MNKQDANRFQTIMQGMADNFRDTITTEGMRLRWELLKGYTIGQIEKACLQIMCTRKYTKMPPVAEFIEAIEGQAPSLEARAEQQWSEIVTQIQTVGFYGTPSYSDQLTADLMQRRFQFRNLCQATKKDLSFIRREFIAAYCAEDVYRSDRMIDYDRSGEDVKQKGKHKYFSNYNKPPK